MSAQLSAWWGLGALAAAAGVGAAIGASTATPCSDPSAPLLCGPGIGGVSGAGTGILLGGIAGLAAALSPKYRAAGLTAAGVTAGLFAIGTINARMKASQTAPQVTP
jgi:hypothetical protein